MYIEINLLPREFRPKKVLIKFDIRIVVILIAIAVFSGVGGYYHHIGKKVAELDMKIAQTKGNMIGLQKQIEFKRQLDEITRKVSARSASLKSITAGGQTRLEVLQHVSDLLPEHLWFNLLEETLEGTNIIFILQGKSFTKTAITDFLQRLEMTGTYSRVTLESINPSEMIGKTPTFQFEISFVIEQASLETAEAGQKPRRERRGG